MSVCGGLAVVYRVVFLVDAGSVQDVAVVPEKLPDESEGATYNLDATEIRNELALANDPENMGAAMGFNKAFEVAANVEAVWCWVYNVPHLVYVSKRKILANEEILVDYGSSYWDRLRMLSVSAEYYQRAAKEVDKQKELTKELVRGSTNSHQPLPSFQQLTHPASQLTHS